MLRRGGHSQGWDQGADAIGAFFGRLMVAVDFEPGFEAVIAGVDPLVGYAAFIADVVARHDRRRLVSDRDDGLDQLFRHEAARLQTTRADAWVGGVRLLDAAHAR